jgi:hypothetical protein
MKQHGEAKKMRLVTDDVYERLMNGNLPPPRPVGASSTAAKPAPIYSESEILNSKTLGDDQKWKLIQQQFHRMLEQNAAQRGKPLKVQIEREDGEQDTVVEGKMPIGDLLTWFPKNQSTKAANVLEFLNARKSIEWDRYGKVAIDGRDIDGARIPELVKHALKASGREPAGWNAFRDYLVREDIPISLISNTALKTILISQSSKGSWSTAEASSVAKKKNNKGDSPSSHEVSSSTPLSGRRTRTAGRKLQKQLAQQRQEEEAVQVGDGRRGGRRRRSKNGKTKKRKSKKGCKGPITGLLKKAAKRYIRWKAFG